MAGPITFDDGARYDRGIGAWSVVAGDSFLDWLAAPPGLRWVDIGCGSGAFTALLARRQQPAALHGIDPSPSQLDFARTRADLADAVLQPGDAMALPYPDGMFDAAAMALVLFFVPDPAAGLAEMVRVTRPGGLVCAYLWDLLDGGFPSAPVQQALQKATGIPPAYPPHAEVSREPALDGLWRAAGLRAVATRAITVTRQFPDFEAFWSGATAAGSLRESVSALSPAQHTALREAVRATLKPAPDGSLTHAARATAVRGIKPG